MPWVGYGRRVQYDFETDLCCAGSILTPGALTEHPVVSDCCAAVAVRFLACCFALSLCLLVSRVVSAFCFSLRSVSELVQQKRSKSRPRNRKGQTVHQQAKPAPRVHVLCARSYLARLLALSQCA